MGLLPAEANIASGRILLERDDILTMSPAARRSLRGSRVSLVFQDPFSVLNPSLRIGEQVGEGLVHHRGFTAAKRTRARSSCSTRSASSIPPPWRAPIRTSCPAACASGR